MTSTLIFTWFHTLALTDEEKKLLEDLLKAHACHVATSQPTAKGSHPATSG